MKTAKIVTLVFCVLFLFCSVSAAPQVVKFTIQFDKEDYMPNDPIYCKMYIKNNGEKPLTLNTRLSAGHGPGSGHEVYFRIIDAAGNKIGFLDHVSSERPEGHVFRTLKPQEFTQCRHDLKGKLDFKRGREYAIQAVYENNWDAEEGISVWKGSVESNLVFLHIM